MIPELPGTPPVVARARAIVRASNMAMWRGVGAGVVVAAACMAVGLVAEPFFLLAPVVWIPVMFYVASRTGPDAQAVEDSQAILEAWADKREAWASRMVEASVAGSDLDVEAWSAADVELRRLGQQSTKVLEQRS